jgi:hypothetical protein
MATSILAQSPAVDAAEVAAFDAAFEKMTVALEVFRPGQADVERVAHGLNMSLSPVAGQMFSRNAGCSGIAEGRDMFVSITPGTIALSVVDANREEKAKNRKIQSRSGSRYLSSSFVDQYVQTSGLLAIHKDENGKWVSDNDIEDYVAGVKLRDQDGKFLPIQGYQFIYDDELPDEVVAVLDEETGELITEERLNAAHREITKWSKKSRMRMVRTLAELVYTDWAKEDEVLAMVTLTLPGDWLTVAPDGKVFKKLFKAFEARCRRALGSWKNLWKLEFQGRGAPHIHLLMAIPAFVGAVKFETWLSQTWADVVAHPDPEEYEKHLLAGTGVDYSGSSYTDPRRIALYFLGHSAKTTDGKEYQHVVPEEWHGVGMGPGRFWGVPGFVKAIVSLEIDIKDFYRIARQLRKLKRSRDWLTGKKRMEGYARKQGVASISAVDVRWRKDKSQSLGATGKLRGGWVLLNDALAVTMQLTEWLHSMKNVR